MATLSALLRHRMPLAAQPLATYAWNGPQSDAWVDELERRRGVVTCHGKRLAAVGALSRPGGCRSPVLAGTRGALQQVSCRASVGLPSKLLLSGPCASSGRPGKLLLPGPCSLRVAFSAGSSYRGLGSNTLLLDGPKRDHGESWRSPGKPCRGVLRLPMHKFGVLRYPYFSTPTHLGAFNEAVSLARLVKAEIVCPF